ncbi:MAG: hypothetical protein MAG551_02468 [Candidatus Scalindua arabica]|uniref:Uncharacterized protein n=1 Tax=Candidatus Scalindua arabica TaxID=1127984 RepID=A0A941W518_9BACT|nr:hypothetical protein [Candidatus Scalindua arabica]
MKRKGKPVRKCHGCILNIGERCAIFDEPHDKWHNSKCSSYNDKELYRKYLEDLEKHPQSDAKIQRKEKAKLHNTEEHHQGNKGRSSN